jgi:hypothetical protein
MKKPKDKSGVKSREAQVEYLRRSFTAVDGLWFMKTEEESGFDHALEMDRRVWEVMGKIQARAARRALHLPDDNSLETLQSCLELKFQAEDYDFRFDLPCNDQLSLTITRCPWQEIIKKADREHLGLKVAREICPVDFGCWAREFEVEVDYNVSEGLCAGCPACVIRFVKSSG